MLVSYDVYSQGNETSWFNCGSEVANISAGGLVYGAKFCRFDKPGLQKVWIMAANEVCAEANLTVLERRLAPRSCYIDPSSVKRDLANYYYEARVYFDGFQPGEELVWACDYTTTTMKLAEDPAAGMQRYETIYCDYASAPKNDTIPVFVGGMPCGAIYTR